MNPHEHTHSGPAAAPHAHDHRHPATQRSTAHTHGQRRAFPPRSLLGASLVARLGVSAGALALLWVCILWALR